LVTYWTEQVASRFLSAAPWCTTGHQLQAEWRTLQFLLPDLKSSMLTFLYCDLFSFNIRFSMILLSLFLYPILATCTLRMNDLVKLPYQPHIFRTPFSSRSYFTSLLSSFLCSLCATYWQQTFHSWKYSTNALLPPFHHSMRKIDIVNTHLCVCVYIYIYNVRIHYWQLPEKCNSAIRTNLWTCKRLKRLKSLYGAFQYLDRLGLLYSYSNKFPHSSPEAPRIIQKRETSTSEGGNYSPRFC
jgi:hypothetical protein